MTVENISQLSDGQWIWSEPCYLRSLQWKIKVEKSLPIPPYTEETLGFYVHCIDEGTSSSWSCRATAILRLIGHKKEEDKKRYINHVFCVNEFDWGFRYFIPWSDLNAPENGYIIDESFTVEVEISAEEPRGLKMDMTHLIDD